MLAEILTIGDEILIGQIVDTNSAYIAKELNSIGISVYQITSVQDEKQHILNALQEAKERANIVIVTGGLGPTKDDITKHTFCTFFKDTLREDKAVLDHVEMLFDKFVSTPISDVNRTQAMVPTKATVLHNAHGTAPGMWFYEDETTFISLPGVPFEMKNLMKDEVLPRLITFYKRPHILHKTLVTYGLGESAIAERIALWEDALPAYIRLAYLPSLGKVRLRMTAKGEDYQLLAQGIAEEHKKLVSIIGDIVYGVENEETIEEVVAKLLTDKGYSLGTAESCTGGKIAAKMTALPGASAYFKGGIVSYATSVKIDVLQVSEDLIREFSVVSEEVAKAMAVGAKELLHTNFAVATTGNAGPTKGESDADVGTVCIAIATPTRVVAETYRMGSHRERIVQKSVNKAFEMLQKEILKM